VALVKAELRQLRADHNRNFKIFRCCNHTPPPPRTRHLQSCRGGWRSRRTLGGGAGVVLGV
jgi:hypothetical protein